MRKYIIEKKEHYFDSGKNSVKIIYLIIFFSTSLFAGRVFVGDPGEVLHEFRGRLYQIRTQLGLLYNNEGKEIEKKTPLSFSEKIRWYIKFNELLSGLRTKRKALQDGLEKAENKKLTACYEEFENNIARDAKRYKRMLNVADSDKSPT